MSDKIERAHILTPDELNAAMAKGRQLRSQAFKRDVVSSATGAARLMRWVVDGLRGHKGQAGASAAH